VKGKGVDIFEEVKDAMQNMRKKICGVIKANIFKKVSEDAARQYEISKEIAMKETLETASRVKYMKKEDRKLKICNQIKEKCIKELFPHLFKAFSQLAMVDI
jgi:transposase-like protein